MKYFGYFILIVLMSSPWGTLFAADGALYLSPSTGNFEVGELYEVVLYADPDSDSANAAEAEITFNPNVVEVALISTAGSVLNLWSTEPTYSNETGVIRFSGWANRPFSSAASRIFAISFRPLTSGTHTININSGALLSASLGGSNIITSFGSGTYIVAPEEVVASSTDSGAGLVLGAKTQSKDLPPGKPIITDYPSSALVGDLLLVKGVATPDSKVVVWVAKKGGKEFQESVPSSSDGSFALISETRLEAGEYRLWAEVYNQRNILGPPSDTKKFSVVKTGYQSLAATGLSVLVTPPPIAIIFLFFGFFLGYLVIRFLGVKKLI